MTTSTPIVTPLETLKAKIISSIEKIASAERITKVELQATSLDLLALYNVARHGGPVVGPVLIQDLSAGITYMGANAAIVKDPVANYAAESENREWQFIIHNLVPVAAPNTGV